MRITSITTSEIYLFTLFLICGISLPSLSGLLVFPFSLMIAPETESAYRIGLPILFLFLTIFSQRSDRFRKYRLVYFAFFVASSALSIDFFINVEATTIQGILFEMLLSTLLIVAPIILLTKISGGDSNSIFLKGGNLRSGLFIGLTGFFFFAVTSIQVATYLFQGQNLNFDKVLPWTPWIFVTVMANGLREELLYRGLFLKKFEPLLGSIASNVLQALIFSLSHTVAGRGVEQYTHFTAVFVLITFLLGLVWGCVMQKTDSVIGSVLFHAGSDIPVFIGIFSNML